MKCSTRAACILLIASVILSACASRVVSESGADDSAPYRMYITNESADVVLRMGFDPRAGFRIEREIPVGARPVELDAPHGVAADPGGRWFYVTMGHGAPFGALWKFEAGPDTLVARVELGRFPASLDVSPDGAHVFVANFNLHGDLVPSTMSVVDAAAMTEVARPELCLMPHGARVHESGARVYTVCMHSDQLVEIDARTFEVAARFSVRPGRERALDPADTGASARHIHGSSCRPTWVVPGTGRRSHLAYVACNGNQEVLEVDLAAWEVRRRFGTGPQPYNAALSPDGRTLGVTLRGDQRVVFFDLDTGEPAASIATTAPITHGIVFSPDGRYAFVTNEAIGSRPGTVDAIRVATWQRTHHHELYLQPTGIDLIAVPDSR